MRSYIFLILFLLCSFTYKANARNYSSNFTSELSQPLTFTSVGTDVLTIPSNESLGKFTPLTGNVSQMKDFYEALNNLKNRTVRIAHYGDSLILGDIITDYLREKLQQRFGGQGVGMMNIISDDNRMRMTTLHSYSEDWEYYSFLTRNPNQLPLGISGALAIPKVGSWVKYETNPVYKSSSSFNVVKVYYSAADNNSTLQYSIDNAGMVKQTLVTGSGVQELVIRAKGNSKKFYMQFLSGKSPLFYGVSLESSGSGIYVDNFPMRGNSGASLADIPEELLE
ncbi:MAG: hypothetical protein Q8S39_11730, partial [Ignavibacteria bacterium]|nr:hypothetical protein [Ignavibacteria bacterium]